MTRAPGTARLHADRIAYRILRVFTVAAIMMFIGAVIGLAIGPL